MGGCISTGNLSTCSSRSNGETVPGSCAGFGSCRLKNATKKFSGHVISLQQHLQSIPNRVFANGKSRTSCMYNQQGQKGINQDAMIVWEDFIGDDVTFCGVFDGHGDVTFCGVFDGHGPHGHIVARKVRDILPTKLLAFWHSYKSKQNRSTSSCSKILKKSDVGNAKKNVSDEDDLNSLWREAFLMAYKAMDKELKSHPNLDCYCSGSTAVTIVKQGSNLFIGHIGDSRAILGAKDGNGSMVATQLTIDLKPDLPREAERIKRCKGRVFAMEEEPEVPRVWLPFDNAPGLAMARAFGDFCLKEYGVISVPEFSHQVLTERDQFIVLASDGVWDVLSNEEVVEIVSSTPSRASAARTVVDSASREWSLKYPASKMDDCAVVCLFLDGKMDSESDYDELGLSSATFQSNHSSNAVESDDGRQPEPSLQRSNTVRSSEKGDAFAGLNVEIEGEGESVVIEDQDWSGLDGLTRVNSLVQLPRFSEEMRSG